MKKYDVAPQKLCEALMKDVYSPFSACVCLDADGRILSIWQFDAAFCREEPVIAPETCEVWLISSHPDGDMRLKMEERRCAERLRSRLGGRPLYTYITSEDFGCQAVSF